MQPLMSQFPGPYLLHFLQYSAQVRQVPADPLADFEAVKPGTHFKAKEGLRLEHLIALESVQVTQLPLTREYLR